MEFPYITSSFPTADSRCFAPPFQVDRKIGRNFDASKMCPLWQRNRKLESILGSPPRSPFWGSQLEPQAVQSFLQAAEASAEPASVAGFEGLWLCGPFW